MKTNIYVHYSYETKETSSTQSDKSKECQLLDPELKTFYTSDVSETFRPTGLKER